MTIKKDLPALDQGELETIERSVEAKLPLSPEHAERLLNDFERSQLRAKIYYYGLGPADGDFRYDANQECFSPKLLVEMGELDPSELDEEEEV